MDSIIIGGQQLFHADCFDIFHLIGDKTIDAIIADLPYGVTKHKEDVRLPFDKLWKEYERIIKDNGAIILFGQGIFFAELICSNKKLFKYDLVWDKKLVTGFLNANRLPLRVHENIAIFYKKLPVYNPQFTEGKPLHESSRKEDERNQNYGKFKRTPAKKGNTKKYPRSIVSFQKPSSSKQVHRTEKSLELLEWLVKTYTMEGDLVLDNVMGSGTCGLAAIKNNRRFIGIEKEKNYYNLTIKRLQNYDANKTIHGQPIQSQMPNSCEPRQLCGGDGGGHSLSIQVQVS